MRTKQYVEEFIQIRISKNKLKSWGKNSTKNELRLQINKYQMCSKQSGIFKTQSTIHIFFFKLYIKTIWVMS